MNEIPWVVQMRAQVVPGMRVLDVGAADGLYTSVLADAVGPTGHVVAVEPDPVHVERLTARMQAEGVADRVTILPCAVADTPGRRTFYRFAKDPRQGSLAAVNVLQGTPDPIEVDVRTLDDILAAAPLNGQVDIVKLDLQGGEGVALQGADHLLAQPVLYLQLELWPAGIAAIGGDATTLGQDLETRGFQLRNEWNRVVSYAQYYHAVTADYAERGFFNLVAVKGERYATPSS